MIRLISFGFASICILSACAPKIIQSPATNTPVSHPLSKAFLQLTQSSSKTNKSVLDQGLFQSGTTQDGTPCDLSIDVTKSHYQLLATLILTQGNSDSNNADAMTSLASDNEISGLFEESDGNVGSQKLTVNGTRLKYYSISNFQIQFEVLRHNSNVHQRVASKAGIGWTSDAAFTIQLDGQNHITEVDAMDKANKNELSCDFSQQKQGYDSRDHHHL